MKAQISVTINREGACCSINCPYFSIETGATLDQPVVEWCRLFKRALEVHNGTDVYRCENCIAKDTVYLRELKILKLQSIHKGKPKALDLLEKINYRFSLYDYDSVPTLVKAILKTKRVRKEEIMDMVEISEEEFNTILDGKEYPYVINNFRRAWGFPKPEPLDDYEAKLAVAVLINKHRD